MDSLKGIENVPSSWEEITEPPKVVPEKKVRKPLVLKKVQEFKQGDGAKDIGDFEKDILEFTSKNKSGSILGNIVSISATFVNDNKDKKPFNLKKNEEAKEEVKKDKSSKNYNLINDHYHEQDLNLRDYKI